MEFLAGSDFLGRRHTSLILSRFLLLETSERIWDDIVWGGISVGLRRRMVYLIPFQDD